MVPGETVTVDRLRGVSTTDAHGDSSVNWDDPDEKPIPGCSLQPVPGSEILIDRNAVISRWKWRGPYDADVTSADRIRHQGVDYEVDGSVQRWWDTSGLDHSYCLLRRMDG